MSVNWKVSQLLTVGQDSRPGASSFSTVVVFFVLWLQTFCNWDVCVPESLRGCEKFIGSELTFLWVWSEIRFILSIAFFSSRISKIRFNLSLPACL